MTNLTQYRETVFAGWDFVRDMPSGDPRVEVVVDEQARALNALAKAVQVPQLDLLKALKTVYMARS